MKTQGEDGHGEASEKATLLTSYLGLLVSRIVKKINFCCEATGSVFPVVAALAN